MAQKIDSQALGKVNSALGITGAGAAGTELMDGTVEQVLDLGPVVRRSQTLAGTQGVFRAVLRNVHPNAGALSSGIDPHAALAFAVAPYPSPLPAKFDLWILGASLTRFTGTAALAEAILQITNIKLAWGINNSGVAVSSNLPVQLAQWDRLVTPLATNVGIGANGQTWNRIGLRMPRDGVSPGARPTLQFQSEVDANAATFDCSILLGVFATTLGQDAVS